MLDGIASCRPAFSSGRWMAKFARAPTELVEHSTLRNRDALHAAYGALATIHHVHALASQQFAIGAGRAPVPEESDSNRDVPPGWVPRVKFFLACGTNTSSAKRLVFAAAAVFMPLEPRMPAGACETLTRTAVRARLALVCMRPCKSARRMRVRVSCAGGGGYVPVQRFGGPRLLRWRKTCPRECSACGTAGH